MFIPDLFTGELTPAFFTPPPSGATGFDAFWAAWPGGPRKVAKRQCFEKWIARDFANFAEHIRLHVEWMKTQEDWIKGFVPMPSTYLNQERWLDWTPVLLQPKPLIDPALAKIANDRKAAAPMPESVRQKLGLLRQGTL